MNSQPDNEFFKYLALDSARFHRARMLHYRSRKKIFEKKTDGYKNASKLEQTHAILFWEHINYVKELS